MRLLPYHTSESWSFPLLIHADLRAGTVLICPDFRLRHVPEM